MKEKARNGKGVFRNTEKLDECAKLVLEGKEQELRFANVRECHTWKVPEGIVWAQSGDIWTMMLDEERLLGEFLKGGMK